MAGSFRIAEAYVEVTADETAYDRAMQRLESRRHSVTIEARLDDGAALARLEQIIRDRTVHLTADLDTRAAADDLTLLTRDRTARITADADTRGAADDLALLARDRRVNLHVDVDRSALGALTGAGGSAGGAAAGLGILSSRMAQLAAAALAALPSVASLGASIAQMGPAAAIAAPALGSLITLGGALAVGLHGVGDAFKSAFETGASTATSAASAARALESAQINVARAARSLKEAQVDAARQIADAQKRVRAAERDLTDAQRDARQAQLDLTRARKEAAEQLEDLNNRLADAELDQRQAVLDLQDAEKELAALKAKGAAANQDDLARAQLAYDRAAQRLEEQQTETARLQEQTAEANAAGVEGSDTVVEAQERVADAQRNVGDRAEAVKDAQQGVADAQVAAARQVRSAQESLADAQRAVAAAMAQGSTEATKFNDAMAHLSANAREFVTAVQGIAPAWSAVRADVQDRLFQGLGATLTRMSAAVLPSVRDGLVGMAGVLNGMGRELMGTFTRLADQGLLKRMFDGFTNGMRPLQKIPGQLTQAFVQLSIAAAPSFQRLTEAAGDAATRISEKLSKALASGSLEDSISGAVDLAKQFGSLLADIGGTIGNIFKAAAAGGGNALGVIGEAFAELRRITAMPEVQAMLATIFRALNDVAKLLAGALGAAIEAVLPVLAALAPVISDLATQLGPVIADLFEALGDALLSIAEALGPILTVVGDALVQIVEGIIPLLEPIGALIAEVLDALMPVLEDALPMVVDVITALAGPLTDIIAALIPMVQPLVGIIMSLSMAFMPLLPAIVQLLPPIGELAVALLSLVTSVLTPLLPLINLVAGSLATVLADALGILVPVLTTVIGWITKFVELMVKGIEWVVDKFRWFYDVLVGHSIIPDLVTAILSWFTNLWDETKRIFTSLKTWVLDTWTGLWKLARSKWDSFWGGMKTALTGAKNTLTGWASGIKTSITNSWNSMWNGARDKVTSIFATIRGKISDFKTWMGRAFSTLRDGIGTTWKGIQSKLAAPTRWVVGHVYNDGIRRMWNMIAGKINSKITLPAISLGFNAGGVVPGRGNKDTVPAMLTPGERILSNAQVARLGGHRGIDAMLGLDQPTGTGGNPNKQQEKTRQGAQGFAKGGIVGTIQNVGDAVTSGLSWAKNVVVGGLKSAAEKAISSLVRPLINRMPAGGFGNLMKTMSNRALSGMLSWFSSEDKKATGGPAVQKALAWARTQNGLPYQWGGNGNPSWDCSGLVSAIESVIRGQKPHRRWATGSFSGNTAPPGWVRGLQSPYMIGITNAGVGHTAGTIGGVNVESRGGDGVVIGSRARSYKDRLFTDRYGFAPATKFDSGGLLAKGATLAVNNTGRPEAVLTADEHAQFRQLVRDGAGDNFNVSVCVEVKSMTMPTEAEAKRFANAIADPMKEAIRKLENSRRR